MNDRVRELLAATEHEARIRFPHAKRVKALWTPGSANGEVQVEVWDHEGRAQVGALPS